MLCSDSGRQHVGNAGAGMMSEAAMICMLKDPVWMKNILWDIGMISQH